jgi:prevent-host-death family protein
MYNNVQSGLITMKQVTFTEFRRNAAALFTSVERGEKVLVFRHGKPIAEVVPVAIPQPAILSWKRPAPALSPHSPGTSLSREILQERSRDK